MLEFNWWLIKDHLNMVNAICSTWLDDQAYGQAYLFKSSEWWLAMVNVGEELQSMVDAGGQRGDAQ